MLPLPVHDFKSKIYKYRWYQIKYFLKNTLLEKNIIPFGFRTTHHSPDHPGYSLAQKECK